MRSCFEVVLIWELFFNHFSVFFFHILGISVFYREWSKARSLAIFKDVFKEKASDLLESSLLKHSENRNQTVGRLFSNLPSGDFSSFPEKNFQQFDS